MKVRTCENGIKQNRYLKYIRNISSPIVLIEVLMTTLMIDTVEGIDTAIFDVTGVYIYAEMPKDKRAVMKLQGKFVDIICEVNP